MGFIAYIELWVEKHWGSDSMIDVQPIQTNITHAFESYVLKKSAIFELRWYEQVPFDSQKKIAESISGFGFIQYSIEIKGNNQITPEK